MNPLKNPFGALGLAGSLVGKKDKKVVYRERDVGPTVTAGKPIAGLAGYGGG